MSAQGVDQGSIKGNDQVLIKGQSRVDQVLIKGQSRVDQGLIKEGCPIHPHCNDPLRWLKAVSSTFQDLDFDVSL